MIRTQPPAHRRNPTSPPAKKIKADPPTTKWHDMHCDPLLDVVLKSNDEPSVFFRASSHALKRESSLFSGMLTSLPNSHMTEADAIPLDFPASSITIFLDAYMVTSHREYGSLDFPTLHKLHKLVQYLDCDRLVQGVATAYNKSCQGFPLLWLAEASNDNDISAAGSAVLRCKAVELPLNNPTIFTVLALVRNEWRHGLFRCLLAADGGESFTIGWPGAEAVGYFTRDPTGPTGLQAAPSAAGNRTDHRDLFSTTRVIEVDDIDWRSAASGSPFTHTTYSGRGRGRGGTTRGKRSLF